MNRISSKYKKSQAALEYLVNYSWAFLIILGTISALTYFGVFNPSRYVPDKCDFGEQLKCVDHFVGKYNDTSSTIYIRFRNNFEEAIKIVEINGDKTYSKSFNQDIAVGEIQRFELTILEDFNLFVGDKEKFYFNVTFKRADESTAQEHTLSGVLQAEIIDNSLGLVS